ncbi:MFS transporter [Rhizosaccharibacter radicis]|uniref:MFS transporter n=1 Tax=Rhizosaccharibacter radicis TaxID=2782605 RepID=A0ABT1VXZ9_9PROT|nr:MFS transporter [Acetobacteraceae bacterium KSS12]
MRSAEPSDIGGPGTDGGAPAAKAGHVVAACYLGWMLDAFDYFIMAFVLDDVARSLGVPISATAFAITLTLASRVVGALVFGRLADRFGRRPTMMVNVVCYAVLELLSGFATDFTMFLVLRALFGIAMGGEWGVASSLAMESIPARWRGLVSGLLQTGYPTGYLLASLLFLLEPTIGWRGMFMLGALPALLVLYIRRAVPESPDWQQRGEQAHHQPLLAVLRRHWRVTVHAALMMACFNYLSHGSQDLYPKLFLAHVHHLGTGTISALMVVFNLGAIAGGLLFGPLSQRIGRPAAIAVGALLCLPAIPLWAFSHGVVLLGLGGFLIQLAVQGAWGVVPAYLNEVSPGTVRGTFPGAVYQMGNLLAAPNANLQLWIAGQAGGDIRWAMGSVVGCAAVLIALLMLLGRDTRDVRMGHERRPDVAA